MIKEVSKAVIAVLDELHGGQVHKAAKYLDTNLVVRATRPVFGPRGKKRVLKGGNFQVVLTIGKPNYEERKFIKACKKAKESFPIKKVQLKFVPKTK